MERMEPIEPRSFVKQCALWFPHAPLHAHHLRAAFPERWLRIHSMTGSRRYPEDAADCQELLKRQNAVATDLFGAGGRFALLWYDYEGGHWLPADHQLADVFGADSVTVMRLSPEDEESEATSIFAGAGEWAPGSLDGLLLQAAENGINIGLLGLDDGALLVPYDGGADVFYPDELARDLAKARYANWLSRHPLGL